MIGAILTKHGSDKDAPDGHSYGPVYEELFAPIRDRVKSVLEIGVQWGKSLKAWVEYFPNAQVIGLDISSDLWSGERYQSFRCDSTNSDQLRAVLGDQTFDVIVDDGSHWHEDQIKTFDLVFPRLNSGGIYVVEDIQHEESWSLFTERGGQIIDLRKKKGRFDDMLAVFRKS